MSRARVVTRGSQIHYAPIMHKRRCPEAGLLLDLPLLVDTGRNNPPRTSACLRRRAACDRHLRSVQQVRRHKPHLRRLDLTCRSRETISLRCSAGNRPRPYSERKTGPKARINISVVRARKYLQPHILPPQCQTHLQLLRCRDGAGTNRPLRRATRIARSARGNRRREKSGYGRNELKRKECEWSMQHTRREWMPRRRKRWRRRRPRQLGLSDPRYGQVGKTGELRNTSRTLRAGGNKPSKRCRPPLIDKRCVSTEFMPCAYLNLILFYRRALRRPNTSIRHIRFPLM
ncbi:hypothetical protein DFH11DRAFT_1578494 [Phellopilus nigrolimitatus]|nr:hypothetical protein DFH11DRAFT_1578494 [Phellopilus nigrolimitatus]